MECGVWGGCWVLGVLGARCWVLGAGCWVMGGDWVWRVGNIVTGDVVRS